MELITDALDWQPVEASKPHRSMKAATATARWLNAQNQGKGRWVYRASNRHDGTVRLDRAPNPRH